MDTKKYLNSAGEWLKNTGPDSDIVVSSRIRLARNLFGFPFQLRATDAQKEEISDLVRDAIDKSCLAKELSYIDLKTASPIDRQVLFERHLISKEHAGGIGERSVAISAEEAVSIMVNEEDHIRMQIVHSGLRLEDAWKEIDRIDDALDQNLNYAFMPDFGYLTCCPTNTGTGMRISVLLHLPALALTKQIEKVFNSLQNVRYSVRGLYGEGSQATGNFYQVSNQVALGKSEEQMIEEATKIVPEIVKFERSVRERMLIENKITLKDRVFRAEGILKNAYTIPSEETMELLSLVRLGIEMDLIKDISLKTVNELFIFTQPGHLQKLKNAELTVSERDMARAAYIREKIESMGL